MADTVNTNSIYAPSNSRRYVVHMTGVSDGTGESGVTKVDISTLTSPDGSAPTQIKVASIRWNIQGYTYIKLYTDRTAANTMFVLSQNGYDAFFDEWGGYVDTATGNTGDLLLTSVGALSGATYDITLELML